MRSGPGFQPAPVKPPARAEGEGPQFRLETVIARLRIVHPASHDTLRRRIQLAD